MKKNENINQEKRRIRTQRTRKIIGTLKRYLVQEVIKQSWKKEGKERKIRRREKERTKRISIKSLLKRGIQGKEKNS